MIRRRIAALLRREWSERTAGVNHKGVARQVCAESQTTAGYFLLLTLANLIALCGLLINSVPVIIGAMLISPLMGPILSFGFGFITGDTALLRQAARKIGLSIALTLIVAAAAAYASPLQIATTEILSRTKPNLFDLLVAIFAGTAGAGALCTKRSILTIVPGVAIATAVIPPLSVAGYGLGTGQWAISWGGFFLFFTNFVAITIVTCLVFLSYGFRPGEGTATTPAVLRNRMLALMAVLLVISVPLVVTLRDSVRDLRDRRAIRAVLQQAFQKEKGSTLAAMTNRELDDGTVSVSAVLNTTEYRSREEVAEAERRLGETLARPVSLYLEQIKTLPGGVVPAAPPVRLRTPAEMLVESGRDARALLTQAVAKLAKLVHPNEIAESSITFGPGKSAVSVWVQLRRDLPLGPEERLLLERYLSTELQQSVRLEVELLPLMAPLVFLPGETELTAAHEAQLLEAGRLFAAGAGPLLRVEAHDERPASAARAKRRLDAVSRYLTGSAGVPADRLRTSVVRDTGAVGSPRVILRFLGGPDSGGTEGSSTPGR